MVGRGGGILGRTPSHRIRIHSEKGLLNVCEKKSRIHSKNEKMPPFFETVSDSKQASKLTKIAEQYVTFNVCEYIPEKNTFLLGPLFFTIFLGQCRKFLCEF